MEVVPTKVFREPWDVDRRLSELKLPRKKLLAIRDLAMNAGANATPFHAANAAGTFAYHDGTWGLRNEFVDGDWVEDRADGIEAVRNGALKIKVAFCNVDLAGDDQHVPRPRSRKGSGAERASGGLFGELPQYAPRQTGDWALFYLMVDERGAAELTRPVVRAGTFVAAVERIHLSNGDDGEGAALLINNNDDAANNFDPKVARK